MAPAAPGRALYGKVSVDAPDGENTYFLVRRLEERLGRGSDAAYRLSMQLDISSQGQAITASDETLYYSVTGAITYRLATNDGSTTVARGRIQNFTGYSATGDTAETLSAQRDARERLMVILADQLVRELNATADIPA